MNLKFSNFRGSFLLEALLATVILGVGLTGVIQSFSMGLEGYQRSREYQKAAVLLENKLTELLSRRYFDDSMESEGAFEEPFCDYRYEISTQDAGQSDILKEVQVTIFWPARQGDRFLHATTYLLTKPEQHA